MNRRSLLIACGAGSLLVSLVILLPADIALRVLSPAAMRATGIAGTLWRGEAREVQISNLRLAQVRWKLSPGSLLLGRLGGNIESNIPGGRASGLFTVAPGGRLGCRDCEISGTLESLRPLIPIRGLAGSFLAKLKILELKGGWPRRAIGSADVKNMPLTLAGQATIEGVNAGFEVKFDAESVPDAGPVEATVRDTAGPLEVQAKLRLTPPANYQFDGTLKPRAGAPEALSNGVQQLGPRLPDGSYQVTFAGSF